MGEYGPVVHEGRLRYLSASQLTAFDASSYGGCARRWWFRNVAKKPERATKATDLGTKVHAQIEHYLKTGEDVLGDIARAGRRFIPRPGPDLLIEHAFGQLDGDRVVSPLTSAGMPFVGRIDLMHARGEWIDDEGTAQAFCDGAETVDWKSTKRIDNEIDSATGVVVERGYAKSGEELARTWQMVGYGVVALARWPDAKVVRSSHGYFQTKGRREASKRSAAMLASEVIERWSSAESLVERMKAAACEQDVERLPANYDACGAYGGCPHRGYCPRDPKMILAESLGRGAAMNLLAKIKAEKEAKEAAAKASSTTPSAAPADVAAEVEALKREEAALKTNRAAVTPPDAPAPSKTSATVSSPSCSVCGKPSTRQIQSASGAALFCGSCEPEVKRPSETASAPPNATVDANVPCAEIGKQIELSIHEVASKKRTCSCGATVKIKPAEMGGKYFALVPKHDVGGKSATSEPKASHDPPGAKATADAPKPKDEKVATFDAKTGEWKPIEKTETADEALARHAHEAAKANLERKQAELPAASSLVLYLDAVEDGVAPQRLETYADRLATALAEQYKAADVRCAPSESPLAFGRYKGALAALVKAEPPPAGAYAVSSASELGMIAFEALASTAVRVVRGVK